MQLLDVKHIGHAQTLNGNDCFVKYVGHNILNSQGNSAYDFLMEPHKTLQQAIVFFSDTERCFEYAKQLRWPDGKVSCPRCGSYEHSFLSTRRMWFCKGCKKQFSIKVGTIFEDSPLGLDKWLCALWMLANCKNRVSSYEIHRAIGVTQKSAWFMLHRLRMVMHDTDSSPLSGEIKMDETFVGGRAKNMHKAKRAKALKADGALKGKTIVVGMLERNGRIKAEVIEARTRPSVA